MTHAGQMIFIPLMLKNNQRLEYSKLVEKVVRRSVYAFNSNFDVQILILTF